VTEAEIGPATAPHGSRDLALRKLVRRFTDVCNAIDYAHSRGVIHRDLKPANIVVGKFGETLVVDWGLAKAIGRADPSAGEQTIAPSSSGSSETLPGSALGTPAYMSPEQARGELDRLGPRSDVYSLGATLYCLLTGKPPFAGDDVGAILRAVQEGHFQRPSQVDPTLDKALEAICLKAMAKELEDRYPTPRALADDLDRWMADEPVTAWREPLSRRARRWARRNRTAVTAAAVGLLAGVVGLAAVLAVQTKAKTDIARSLNRETNANTALAAANNKLVESRAAAQARYDLAVDAIKTFHTGVSEDFLLKEEKFKDLRDRLLKSAGDFYGKLGALLGKETDPPARRALAQANFELAELTGKVGRTEDALVAHRAVLARREELAAELAGDVGVQVDLGRSLTAVAGLLNSTGKIELAEATYRKAEALLGDLVRSSPAARAGVADCRSGLGYLWYTAGKSADALEAYRLARADQEALAAAPGATNEARRDLARTIHLIGLLLSQTAKPSEAEAEFREAIAISQKVVDENPAVAQFRQLLSAGHSELGILLWQTGKLSEAEAEYRKAIAISQKVVDDNPAVTQFSVFLANHYDALGRVLSNTGKPSAAQAEQRKALALRQKLADDNPAVPEFRSSLEGSHYHLGSLLWRAGKLSEAEAEYRKAIPIEEKLADDNPAVTEFRRNLADSHTMLGIVRSSAGKPSEAEAEYRTAISLYQKLADDNPKSVVYRSSLANCLCELGDSVRSLGRPAEAKGSYDRAIPLLEQAVKESPTVTWSRLVLAGSLRGRGLARRDLGDPAGAAADARRALSLYDGVPSRDGDDLFHTACCRAALAGLAGNDGSGVSAAEAKPEADQAMALLRKAVDMGYRNAAKFRTESALDPLRKREDFQKLLQEVETPPPAKPEK
jgi:eukaryotic-like serine/threonine-protein kinase